jgi:hypothetical protein
MCINARIPRAAQIGTLLDGRDRGMANVTHITAMSYSESFIHAPCTDTILRPSSF